MSSVNFYCERQIKHDGTLRIKKKIYYDPRGLLSTPERIGSTIKVENPHHPRYAGQEGKLYVYTMDDFLITSVVPVEEQGEANSPENRKSRANDS